MSLNFFDGRRIDGGAFPAVLALALFHGSCLAAEPRVLVLNEANAPPFSNPQRTGFFDVVATEAFRRAGLELRIDTVPAARALLLSDSGASDGELNRVAGIEAQYPNLVRVPEKLGEWQFAAFSSDRSIQGGFDALRGRAVGFVRGWRVYEQALAGHREVIAVHDPDQMFRLLQLKRIEVALYERSMGLAYIKAHAVNDVRSLDPPLFTHEAYIHLHKSHAGQAPAIAAALRAMKRDGAYQRAYRERLLAYIGEGSR